MALCFWKGHPYNRWILLSSIMPIPWWVLLFVGYRSSGYVVSEKALISELPHLQVINQILTCCIGHFWTIFCWFPNFNEKCRQELDSMSANSIFPCLSCLVPNLSKKKAYCKKLWNSSAVSVMLLLKSVHCSHSESRQSRMIKGWACFILGYFILVPNIISWQTIDTKAVCAK